MKSSFFLILALAFFLGSSFISHSDAAIVYKDFDVEKAFTIIKEKYIKDYSEEKLEKINCVILKLKNTQFLLQFQSEYNVDGEIDESSVFLDPKFYENVKEAGFVSKCNLDSEEEPTEFILIIGIAAGLLIIMVIFLSMKCKKKLGCMNGVHDQVDDQKK
jgi:uncharacterized membrane protein